MSPRTGRPTEEPKNIRVGVRLTEKEKKMFCSMDIGQLTEELFRLPVFLNEVV